MLLNQAKRRFYKKENSLKLSNGVIVPRKIVSRLNGEFDVTNSVLERLNNPSPPELEFFKYFPGALKEIPFFIKNLYLWDKLCDRHGISMNNPIRWKLYHQVDFLFPNSSVVIELDSLYHKGKETEDLIRDKYLWEEYGIKVLRYWKTNFANDLENINMIINQIRPIPDLKYQEVSDEYFEFLYKDQISRYYDLLIHNNYLRDSTKKTLIITTSDLGLLNWTVEDIYSMNKWSKKYLRKELCYLKVNIPINKIERYYNDLKPSQYNFLQQLGYL